MRLPGAPLPPRSCLDRGTRSPTNDSEVNAMRAAAWHRHGVAALPVAGDDGEDESTDDHEQGNAGVAFVDQRDQRVARAQVSDLGMKVVE